MNDFSEYISNYIADLKNKNANDPAKVNFFMAYLEKNFGSGYLASPELFGTLDKEFFLDCINYYMQEMQPARTSAEDYRRVIIDFCENICKKYKIQNIFLESTSERTDFQQITKSWFDSLKNSESRKCMSSKEFEKLDDAIRNFFNDTTLEENIYNSIVEKKSKSNYYGHLVSVLALELINEFGVNNQTIANLKITDLNVDSKIIKMCDFVLPIKEDLLAKFKLYLTFRSLVLQKTKSTSDFLFVKKTGDAFLDSNSNPDAQLFLFLQNVFKSSSTTSLRYRTIRNLVAKGANISLLYDLTAVKTETILNILDSEDKSTLENIFKNKLESSTTKKKSKKIGQIQCPYCGDYKDASSENWILIQVDGNQKKYIACKECKGLDGKYRY